jgi:hypothetical protein
MKLRLRLSSQTTPNRPAIRVEPALVVVRSRPTRVLDFDVEARPLHWISGDYVSKEITAIAWAWTDEPDRVTCYLLGETDPREMLHAFLDAYRQADMVTGHFIRGYDLPMVNGALTEYGLPTLPDVLTHDTKLDLVRRQGLSGSQENLGVMLGLEHGKVKMDQKKWRDANRLTPEGLLAVRDRVIGDVQQHIEMRARLLALGYLGPPRQWRSGSARAEEYTP